ncbi:MAG TPA: periplasmic heavy metal sensor [Thermoanaerobaculia bacterium]|nr:periplasmic heavy metal sensor [Thermoanaerobaculia bacterium]
MRKLGLTMVILMACAASVIGQEAPPPPQPLQVVAAVLQLSDAQIASWVPILQAREQALQPLQQQLRSNQEAIGKELQSPTPDAQRIGQLFIDRRGLEMSVGAIASQSAGQFEELLTSDQRQRLQQIRGAAQVCPIVPAFNATGLM